MQQDWFGQKYYSTDCFKEMWDTVQKHFESLVYYAKHKIPSGLAYFQEGEQFHNQTKLYHTACFHGSTQLC